MPNNYILLETIALTQSAASVTFDNLPTSGYTDLKLVISARSSVTSGSNTWEDIGISFNGGAVNNSVTSRVVFGYSSTVGSATNANWAAGFAAAPSATASTFSNTELYIPNYRSNVAKSYSGDTSSETNAASGINGMVAGLWNPVTQAAITSIGFSVTTGTSPLFVAGSTFSLYGIAALGTTPVLAPKATGGNRIENDGTYWIHTFTSSGVFIPQTNLTCDYLVVAGGGGGGDRVGGGGGAGGFRTGSSFSVTTTPYTVTIGSGGAGGNSPSTGTAGTAGVDSIFGSITSTGGGRGGCFGTSQRPTTGGSGGGAGAGDGNNTLQSGAAGNTPSTSPSQGFGGGSGNNNANTSVNYGYTAGGGGGSGGAGVDGVVGSASGGGGGAGTSNSYSGSAVTYAAGGAGSDGFTLPSETQGATGGANTGNGGGGSGGPTYSGGAGGSGIVIVRYPIN
jgi:hypothetical protein